MFVEIVRLLVVVGATATGYGVNSDAPMLGSLLGASIGYVVGGILGRSVARGLGILERSTRRYSAPELLVGTLGAAVVGGFAAVSSVAAVVLLPPEVGWPTFGLAMWVGTYAGFRVASRRSRELLDMLGLAARPVSATRRFGDAPSSEDAFLLDTSVLIDGRLLRVVRTGFLRGDLLVPRFVLDELQGLADAQDPARRRKGRRGLEVIDAISEERRVRVHLLDDTVPGTDEVDQKLLALARREQVTLLTLDQPLAKLARVAGLIVVDFDNLLDSLRSTPEHGEIVTVKITKPGKEPGQGVAFLSDGSMLVIADAAGLVGELHDVEVVSSLATSVGRLFFGTLVGGAAPALRTPPPPVDDAVEELAESNRE